MPTATKPHANGYSAELHRSEEACHDGDGNARSQTVFSYRMLLDGEEIGWTKPQRNAQPDDAIHFAEMHRRDSAGLAAVTAAAPERSEQIGSLAVGNLMLLAPEESAAKEAQRSEREREREAAAEKRHEQEQAEWVAEENVRQGRVSHGVTVRA
jgi:hypothetical protein